MEIKLSPTPKAGATDSIDVEVAAVCGETITEKQQGDLLRHLLIGHA